MVCVQEVVDPGGGEGLPACGARKASARFLSLSATSGAPIGPASSCRLGLLRDERAVHEELDQSRVEVGGFHLVGALEGVDLEAVVASSECKIRTVGTGPLHPDAAVVVSTHVDLVVAVDGVDDDAVGRCVAGRAAERACEVDVGSLTSVPVKSLTVTTSSRPRALKSTCSTPWVSIVMLAGWGKNRDGFRLRPG